jgi:hypothetical protein
LPGFIDVSFVVEIVLAALLAATVGYCAVLERRLRGLRQDQAALTDTVQALNSGILRAQASLTTLRSAAAEAGAALDKSVTSARTLTDELSLMVAAGERVATRIEAGRQAAPLPAERTGAPRIIRNAPAATDKLRALR